MKICYFSKLLVWMQNLKRLLIPTKNMQSKTETVNKEMMKQQEKFSYKENKKVGNSLYARNLDFFPWHLYSRFNLLMCTPGHSCKIH
jgi:hypothetical protein